MCLLAADIYYNRYITDLSLVLGGKGGDLISPKSYNDAQRSLHIWHGIGKLQSMTCGSICSHHSQCSRKWFYNVPVSSHSPAIAHCTVLHSYPKSLSWIKSIGFSMNWLHCNLSTNSNSTVIAIVKHLGLILRWGAEQMFGLKNIDTVTDCWNCLSSLNKVSEGFSQGQVRNVMKNSVEFSLALNLLFVGFSLTGNVQHFTG